MTRLYRIATCVGVLSASMMGLVAKAEDLPSEGKFSITYTAVNPSPIKPLAVGKDRELVVGTSIMTAVNDSGAGLLHNMTGRCFVFSTIDRAAKTLDVRGQCNYSDRSGDQVYEEFSPPARSHSAHQ
jgi:hypothetical protein